MKPWGPDRLRTQLDFRDFTFIARQVNGSGVEDWMLEPAARDELLDAPELFNAITQDKPLILMLSQRLFFYVFIRSFLRERGLQERCLADFLGLVLRQWTYLNRGVHKIVPSGQAIMYWIDHTAAIRSWEASLGLANYALLQSTIGEAFVLRRQARRGAPGPAYYSGIAKNLYSEACVSCAQDKACTLEPVLQLLLEAYEDVTESLRNLLRDLHV